jgi:hypothetical protein
MKKRAWYILTVALAGCVTPSHETAPVPVEVWTGGDDGLTQRLRDAVEDRLRASPRFVMLPGGVAANPLRVTIPTHVHWRDFGLRTRVRYQLELIRGGRDLGRHAGSCWEAELNRCADQILRAAEIVAAREHEQN